MFISHRTFCGVLYSLVSLWFCASCSLNKQVDNLVKIEADATINLSSIDGFNEDFFISHEEELAKCGWTYSDGELSFVVSFPEKTLETFEGNIIHTNNESKADLSSIPNSSLDSILIKTPSSTLILHLINGKYEIDLYELLLAMDGSCCMSEEMTKSGRSVPRCIDYNGPLGNGQNDQGKMQSIINFIGSDCSYAVMQGLCLDEHENGMGGCYNTHGGVLCTDLI